MKTNEKLLQAIEDLLPQHMLLCVSQPDPQTHPWTFHSDESGKGLVTKESCRCPGRIKEIRAMLPTGETAGKGFSPNAPVEAPVPLCPTT
jgi:hypothetical protein